MKRKSRGKPSQTRQPGILSIPSTSNLAALLQYNSAVLTIYLVPACWAP